MFYEDLARHHNARLMAISRPYISYACSISKHVLDNWAYAWYFVSGYGVAESRLRLRSTPYSTSAGSPRSEKAISWGKYTPPGSLRAYVDNMIRPQGQAQPVQLVPWPL